MRPKLYDPLDRRARQARDATKKINNIFRWFVALVILAVCAAILKEKVWP